MPPTRKKKVRRGTKITGSTKCSSGKEDTSPRCRPITQRLPPALITAEHAPQGYVPSYVHYTQTGIVDIGGCILPLPEVAEIKLGSLKCLQHEMETTAQMPVTFDILVRSKSTTKLTDSDANVLVRIEAIDTSIQAYQAAWKDRALTHCANIQSNVLRYCNEICQCRQSASRTEIMSVLYQHMKNIANMMAVDTIKEKLRDPAWLLTLHYNIQHDECLETLQKMKRLLEAHNRSTQKMLCVMP